MKTVNHAALAAALAVWAIPAVAQGQSATNPPQSLKTAHHSSAQHKSVQKHSAGKPHGKQPAGEAARLEEQETGTTAEVSDRHPEKQQPRKTNAAKSVPGAKNNAHMVNANAAKTKAASSPGIKTAQLTSGKTAPAQTRKTALSKPPSNHHQQPLSHARKSNAQADEQPDKSANETHLKKHNARMF